MKVLITGVNGFIGNHLAEFFNENNIEVYGTSSKNCNNKYCKEEFIFNIKNFSETNIPTIIFDWVIHCSYDKNSNVKENIDATIKLSNLLQKNRCKNQLFLSSISSISGNISEYAELKSNIEKWFLDNNFYVIRLGLVIGKGGLFASMIKKVVKLPILPLIDKGQQKVKLIGLNDVIINVFEIITLNKSYKSMNLFYKNEVTLEELLSQISKFYKKRIFFINIPYRFILLVVIILNRLRINLGITIDNVKGLKNNDVYIKSDIEIEKSLEIIFENNL